MDERKSDTQKALAKLLASEEAPTVLQDTQWQESLVELGKRNQEVAEKNQRIRIASEKASLRKFFL